MQSNKIFYINNLNSIKDNKYFSHVPSELKNAFNDILVMLLDNDGFMISGQGRTKFDLGEYEELKKSRDNKKPSESSNTKLEPSNIIKFNVQGGTTGDANFMNDPKYGWVCHELGHEMYNRKNIQYENLIDVIKFEELLVKNNYLKKDKNGDIIKQENYNYLSYPDGKDERVACFYQYDYLKTQYNNSNDIVEIEKESYPSTWNEIKPKYFTSWFEYFQNK